MSKQKTERNNLIREKKEEGWTYRKIADCFDLNVKTVWDIVNPNGVGGYPQKGS